MPNSEKLVMIDATCPEFYITHIGRIESAGGDNFRLWCCIARGGVLEPMCTMIVPKDFLAANSQQCITAVANHEMQCVAGMPKH